MKCDVDLLARRLYPNSHCRAHISDLFVRIPRLCRGLYRAPSRLLIDAVRLATDITEATASQPVPEPELREKSYVQSQPASVFERLSESALTTSIAPVMTSNSPSVQPGVRSVWERLQNGAASGSASGLDPPASSAL